MLSPSLVRPSPASLPSLALPNIGTSSSRLSHGLLLPTWGVSPIPKYKTTHLLQTQKKTRKLDFACFYKPKEKLEPASSQKVVSWPILEKWDVPWEWQTLSLTMFACGVSFALTGLVEASVLPYLGFDGGQVSLDEKAEILFAGQFTVTAVVLGVLYGITNTFRPLPDDLFRYDLKEPFKLWDGWVLWAGIGLVGAIIAVALVGASFSIFNGEQPQRETDSLIRLLPLIGSSGISTACLVGITGVLAPFLEETVFRGFLMASLTKWVPTPVSVIISAALFAFAHLTPGQFPQLFVLGTVLGLSYAQTRNLLTPITIHAFWNSGVILLLTFLQLMRKCTWSSLINITKLENISRRWSTQMQFMRRTRNVPTIFCYLVQPITSFMILTGVLQGMWKLLLSIRILWNAMATWQILGRNS